MSISFFFSFTDIRIRTLFVADADADVRFWCGYPRMRMRMRMSVTSLVCTGLTGLYWSIQTGLTGIPEARGHPANKLWWQFIWRKLLKGFLVQARKGFGIHPCISTNECRLPMLLRALRCPQGQRTSTGISVQYYLKTFECRCPCGHRNARKGISHERRSSRGHTPVRSFGSFSK